ncbi:unnamed protein product [Diabrotica balteata]|uniref:Peptidase S1 domain-containing protein n=1 Tax=Diabrotica balteata TaxID=107213 RepID=A0A9N9SW15_DIABA|nr:unnamed protein product [Diabrotica balteata]
MWHKKNRLNTECKVYKAKLRINIAKTGGGTIDIKEDPLLDLIANLIGRATVGIKNVNDCDAISNVNDSVIVQTVVFDMEDIEIEEMVVSDIDVIIEEESEATITPGPFNILNQTALRSRRRPKVLKCNKDILAELKIENERKKAKLLDDEQNRLMAAEKRATWVIIRMVILVWLVLSEWSPILTNAASSPKRKDQGMCVDAFMFGSCCAHNSTQNTLLPPQQQHYSNKPQILYTHSSSSPSQSQNSHSNNYNKPTKPLSHYISTSRPKPNRIFYSHQQASNSTRSSLATPSSTLATSTNEKPEYSWRISTPPPRPQEPMRPQLITSLSEKVTPMPTQVPSSTSGGVTMSTTSAASVDIPCGVPQMFTKPQTRIVGGKNAPFGRWPWQVSVRRTSFFGFSSTHRCGGAVLNENWMATAGHCVDDLLTSQIRIRVGEYDFSNIQEQLPYVERGVSQKIVHPKYNYFTYEYDLALVQVDKPLEFLPHISPICLPASNDLLIGEKRHCNWMG